MRGSKSQAARSPQQLPLRPASVRTHVSHARSCPVVRVRAATAVLPKDNEFSCEPRAELAASTTAVRDLQAVYHSVAGPRVPAVQFTDGGTRQLQLEVRQQLRDQPKHKRRINPVPDVEIR